jgi:hypothetical protein
VGYMGVQLQVAYSQSIFGTAVFAGGPYYCAQGSINSALGYCEGGSGIPLQTLIDYTNAQAAASGKIDPTSHIANKPIYMVSGTNDTTVRQGVMNTLQQYYETYTNSSNIAYNKNTQAAHAWISPGGPNSCPSSYIPISSSIKTRSPEAMPKTIAWTTLASCSCRQIVRTVSPAAWSSHSTAACNIRA